MQPEYAMWKWIIFALACALMLIGLGVIWWVQREAPYRFDDLSSGPETRALILYHPSRDAHFSDDLTQALAAGFFRANMAVSRATITGKTDATPDGYALIAIITNTYFGRPDWPTFRYLARADFRGTPVIAITAGAGDTDSAQRALEHDIRQAHGNLLDSRALWTKRPNGVLWQDQDNRVTAQEIAEKMAVSAAWQVRLGTARARQSPNADQKSKSFVGVSS